MYSPFRCTQHQNPRFAVWPFALEHSRFSLPPQRVTPACSVHWLNSLSAPGRCKPQSVSIFKDSRNCEGEGLVIIRHGRIVARCTRKSKLRSSRVEHAPGGARGGHTPYSQPALDISLIQNVPHRLREMKLPLLVVGALLLVCPVRSGTTPARREPRCRRTPGRRCIRAPQKRGWLAADKRLCLPPLQTFPSSLPSPRSASTRASRKR